VKASLNYRLAEVVMILLLPLLAVSLAVPPKRSSSSLGVFISIVMVVAYHKVNEYGEQVSALANWTRGWRCGCRSASLRRSSSGCITRWPMCPEASRSARWNASLPIRPSGSCDW
jgi:hypothetical protein